jgi:hypothetical protein
MPRPCWEGVGEMMWCGMAVSPFERQDPLVLDGEGIISRSSKRSVVRE